MEPVGSVTKVALRYGRQQFYADRTARIGPAKTTQIGVEDRVTISKVSLLKQLAPYIPIPAGRSGAITYENPRKTIKPGDTGKKDEFKPMEVKRETVSGEPARTATGSGTV